MPTTPARRRQRKVAETPSERLLIAVPSMGGTIKSMTAVSLVRLTRALLARGIDVQLHNVDSADIVTARDICANMLLHADPATRMLFVDSDMHFAAEVVLKLIDFNVDVCGVACVKRGLELAALVKFVREHGDLDRAKAQSSVFNLKPHWNPREAGPLPRRGSFRSVAAIGMGIALIRGSALRAMVEDKVVVPRKDLRVSSGGTCWSFFGTIEHEGTPLTEDYSFCFRWSEIMGREVWACVDEEVGHVGSFVYSARFDALG